MTTKWRNNFFSKNLYFSCFFTPESCWFIFLMFTLDWSSPVRNTMSFLSDLMWEVMHPRLSIWGHFIFDCFMNLFLLLIRNTSILSLVFCLIIGSVGRICFCAIIDNKKDLTVADNKKENNTIYTPWLLDKCQDYNYFNITWFLNYNHIKFNSSD